MLDSTTLTTEALCRSILERHHDTIQIQKPEFAIRKLTRIITAALDLANAKSFHGMSLRDLSAASGISMGGLYAYFDSKTTLARMILEEVTAQVRLALEAPPADVADDPVRHLEWLIDTHIRLTEILQPWFVFSFMEAKHFPARNAALPSTTRRLPKTISPASSNGACNRAASAPIRRCFWPRSSSRCCRNGISSGRNTAAAMSAWRSSASVQAIVLRSCLPA
ncbi:TetR/AcrR family transcriptional regulator [Seohaeicola zhoushanensis]